MTETEKAVKAIIESGELIKLEPESKTTIINELQSVLRRWSALYGKDNDYYSKQGSKPSKTGRERGRPKLSTVK